MHLNFFLPNLFLRKKYLRLIRLINKRSEFFPDIFSWTANFLIFFRKIFFTIFVSFFFLESRIFYQFYFHIIFFTNFFFFFKYFRKFLTSSFSVKIRFLQKKLASLAYKNEFFSKKDSKYTSVIFTFLMHSPKDGSVPNVSILSHSSIWTKCLLRFSLR